ncbi:MAG: OmpA family protein [Lacrimispora sp.]|uniref:OmpA family protein n=1 Tax=Lacrimispora sp. TaxID=2719234 RepID=UPI0039E6369D
MRSKFEDEDEDDDEGENWLASYSDLMTDLLAVFVILFAFAMMSQAVVIQSERKAAEQNQDISQSTTGGGGNFDLEEFNSLYEHMKTYVMEAGLSEQLNVEKLGDEEILLRISASILFDSGKADIDPAALPMLQNISDILVYYQEAIQMIRIEGHTDNRPIKTSSFDSNWELSTSRAVNVLKHLLETSGIEAKKFSAIGYSEFYPVADNSTDEGKGKNRRVDFYIKSMGNDSE